MAEFGVHSEYGPLREVVVGAAADLALPPYSADLGHYNGELAAALKATDGAALDIAEAFPDRHRATCRQIEDIVAVYEREGVTVHRPRPFTAVEKNHLGDLQPGHSQLYPADPVFVIGKHFLELNIRRAYRRKEIFPLRDVVESLIADDAEARWVAMPQAQPHRPSGQGPGPFLEGGDILINGRDIIVGIGNLCSNRAGVEWLKRYIEPFGYRVHPLPLADGWLHALGVMCLLREGLAMAYLPALPEGLPEPLRGWDIIELTHEEAINHATVGVSLDAHRYMIDPRFNRVIDELARRRIEAIPTPCDAIGYWGGAIRCLTLPLSRGAA